MMNARKPKSNMCGVALTLLLSNLPPAATADPNDVNGSWAGWAYLNEGGDFPLRIHFEHTRGVIAARLDFPHARLYEVTADAAAHEGERVTFTRINSQGKPYVFTGNLDGGDLTGSFTFDGAPYGEFELHRSALPLPYVDPETYSDLEGTFRFDNGDVLVLTPRFWGEMLCRELATGRYATLFPLSQDTFFAGTAVYVPSQVRVRLEVHRKADGEIENLAWTVPDAATRYARRVRVVEESLTIQNGDIALAATLLRPEGQGPFPAAVVLGGSSWSTRAQIQHDAQMLALSGVAALIYDKRGYGESNGERDVAFVETAGDAVAAVRLLRARDDIRPTQVGMTGRSRGGWLAPLAASRSSDVAFLVLFVPPAVSPAEQEHTRRLNVMRADGVSARELEIAERYLKELWEYCRSAGNWESYAEARRELEDIGWADAVAGPATPEPSEWTWSRLNMHYDPIPALERVTVPTLAIFGGADRNVVPELNRPLMEAALERAGNRNATMVVIPDADHGLRDARQGALPLHRRTAFSARSWTIVRDWLAEHVDVPDTVQRNR